MSGGPPRLTTFAELHAYAGRLALEPAFDPASDEGYAALVGRLAEAIRASPTLQALAAGRVVELLRGGPGIPNPEDN